MKHIVSSIISLIFALKINAQNDGFEKVNEKIINCCRNNVISDEHTISPFNTGKASEGAITNDIQPKEKTGTAGNEVAKTGICTWRKLK